MLPEEHIMQHVVKIHITKQIEDSNFVQLARTLNLHDEKNLDSHGSSAISISLIEAGKQKELQTHWLMKSVCETLRCENKVDQVIAFIQELDLDKIMDASVKEEMTDFKVICDPWSESVTTAALHEACKKFMENPTLNLHKPLRVFATGVALVAKCEEAKLQRIVDEGLIAELNSIVKPPTLTKSNAKTKFGDDKVQIALPNQDAWVKMSEGVKMVKAKCSLSFVRLHAATFLELTTLERDAADSLSSVAYQRVDGTMNKMFEHINKHCKTNTLSKAKAVTDVKKLFDTVGQAATQGEQMGLNIFTLEGACKVCVFFDLFDELVFG